MAAREERRKYISSLTALSKNTNGGRNAAQFNHYLQLTKRNLNYNSSIHLEFNSYEQTPRQMSVISGRQNGSHSTFLTNRNNALETQNKNLKKQIEILNINASSDHKVTSDYIIPYVKISEEIELFSAKFYIRPEEYPKIEYEQSWLFVFDASIKIYKTSDFENQEPKKKLLLKHIKQVKYMDNIMFFVFQPAHEEFEYLFIKFRDYDHLKKWDFALFINKIIEQSMNKQKLFFQQINLHQYTFPTKKLGSISQSTIGKNRKVSYNDNLMKNQLSQHLENVKISKSSSVKNVLHHEKEKEILNEQREYSDKNSSITNKFKKEKESTEEIYIQIQNKKKRLNTKQSEIEIEKVNWKYDEDPYKTPPNNNNKIDYNSSFGAVDQFKIKPIQAKDTQLNNDKVGNPLDASTLTNTAQTKKKIMSSLKQPKLFTKCAKDGVRQRQKQVYLSQNQVQLCWKDLQTNAIHSILLADIKDISKNQKGEGLRKHAKKVNPQNCLVIRTYQGRVVQLYSDSAQMIADFADNLETIVFKEETTNNYQD